MARQWKTLREFEEIKFEFFEGIAKITINRPRYYNAFTPDTTREMSEALVACREMTEVRAVILTGEGDKAFCAGGDIADLYASGSKGDFDYGRTFWRDEYRLNALIFAMPSR